MTPLQETDISWNGLKHWGFGGGWAYFGVDVDATDDDLTGTIEYTYQGPYVFFKVRF